MCEIIPDMYIREKRLIPNTFTLEQQYEYIAECRDCKRKKEVNAGWIPDCGHTKHERGCIVGKAIAVVLSIKERK